MELKTKRVEFLSTLYWTQSIVERRNTMPILSNVLIEAQDGNDVRITATDLEVGVRATVGGEVSQKGEVTVNAKKLYEIVREAPEDIIRLKRLDNDWVEIRSGKSVFKMVGIDAREFPQFPQFDGDGLSSLPAAIIKEMIEKTIFSVSTDETRYSLNGVFVEEKEHGKLHMVATDGHRLAVIERAIGSVGLAKGVILPRKGLAEVRKLLEGAEDGVLAIGFRENLALVVKERIELFMRLIDGDFPDYGKVIPKDNPYPIKVEQDQLLKALRRVSILSSERYRGVKLEVGQGKISISTSNPDLGEAVEEIEVGHKGKQLSVGFNARYLIDVLGVLGEGGEVEISLKDEVSPGIIKKINDEGYLYVVMPMRL
jgi:DNA polymerase-3 subunit beta